MNIDLTYIISQIFIIITYTLLGISYFVKKRKKILICNSIAHIFQTISLVIVNKYTGASMAFITVIRDNIFLLDIKDNKNDISNNKLVLIILFAIILLITIFTYNGLYSLFSTIAVSLSTIGLWHDNTRFYKAISILANVMWLCYYIYINSFFGYVIETIIVTCTIIGFLRHNKEKNIQK